MKYLILSLLCLITTNHSFAAADVLPMGIVNGQDRGGGNVFEAEFKSIGKLLLQQMQQRSLTESQTGFALVRFEVALNEVVIVGTDSQDQVQLAGNDRQAVNSVSEKQITFKNSVWAILDSNQKRLLVLHEYLRFVGVDDSEYTFSVRIMDLMKMTAPDPAKVGHTYRIESVPSTHSTWFTDSISLKLEGITELSTLKCGHSANWLTLRFRNKAINVKLEKRFPSAGTCQNTMAFISSVNNGADVFVTISPGDFQFN